MSEKTYRVHDTCIGVRGGKQDLLDKIFEMLTHRGFRIQTDQKVLKDFPTLADTRWEAAKGDLLFKAQIYLSGFEFKFYQELNTKNSYGGYYDFDQFMMMPYLIRCQYILTQKYIFEILDAAGYINTSTQTFKYALDNVMYKIKSCSHYTDGKELPDYEFPSYNATDRDGKQLKNGQLKYFRDGRGRLKRGTIYHNINNMWWVVINKFEYRNVAAFDLFDITAKDLEQKRIQSKVMPQRIRAKKLREKYTASGVSYKEITEEHIQQLRIFLTKAFAEFEGDLDLNLSKPRKKDSKWLKRTGLQYAEIKCDAEYFSGREAITFSSTGFIGFAHWASDRNLKPFVDAFEKWLDWLTASIGVAA